MGTFKSQTKSYAATTTKLKRMCKTFSGTRTGFVAFATFMVKNTLGDYSPRIKKMDVWYIEGYSNYHSSESLEKMYKTNGKAF